jgi:hypothetical protein
LYVEFYKEFYVQFYEECYVEFYKEFYVEFYEEFHVEFYNLGRGNKYGNEFSEEGLLNPMIIRFQGIISLIPASVPNNYMNLSFKLLSCFYRVFGIITTFTFEHVYNFSSIICYLKFPRP